MKKKRTHILCIASVDWAWYIEFGCDNLRPVFQPIDGSEHMTTSLLVITMGGLIREFSSMKQMR